MIGEIIAVVLAWLTVCFVAGTIETWLEQRKWEKQRKDRGSEKPNMRLPI